MGAKVIKAVNAVNTVNTINTIDNQQERDALGLVAAEAQRLTGIHLTPKHFTMIESRLKARMLDLGLPDIDGYFRYYKAHEASESQFLIGLITTHHTAFFREFTSFEFLEANALTELIRVARTRPDLTLRVWSAGCSRGQEVYSLAMFLSYHLARMAPDIKFEILGTDVDPESIRIAQNGVYPRSEIQSAPIPLLANHWARGTGEISDFVKAKPSLRQHCRFEVANLEKPLPLGSGKFDLIFCRNVLIYFTPEQVKAIASSLLGSLSPSGYLVTGVSESIRAIGLPIVPCATSIYRHAALKEAPRTEAPRSLRVFCVDDSATILVLLKKILTPERGFEIVGTAANGKEARAKLAGLKADVVTLDIHMPEEDGISYLEKAFGPSHPPVVMVSSVSRDNSDLALRALRLGASDFVEKPAMSNLAERGEELMTKLKCAVRAAREPAGTRGAIASIDTEFQRKFEIADPASMLRIAVLQLSDRKKLMPLVQALKGPQPPLVVAIEGAGEALDGIAKGLSLDLGVPVQPVPAAGKPLGAGQVYVVDLKSGLGALRTPAIAPRTVFLVYGEVTAQGARAVTDWGGSRVLLEELADGKGAQALRGAATDVFPATSFAAISTEYLSGKGKA